MHKVKVGVLRGGPSSEYDVSLKTGGAVLKHIDTDKYAPVDIFIDKEGVWHVRGAPTTPNRSLRDVDVVFNALHGTYGEDGIVQKLLSSFSIPYTGSKALSSAIAMNKYLTKQYLRPYADEIGFKLAKDYIVEVGGAYGNRLHNIYKELGGTVVIKPINGGSSVGVTIARDLEAFKEGVVRALLYAPRVLAEQYIEGKEATCGAVDEFRNVPIYALLPIEIVPPSSCSFFDYHAKYSGQSQEICPGNFKDIDKRRIEYYAREIHRILGLRHYSRSDFILGPDGIYFLEVNTLPGLTEESLVPKALKAVGCSFPSFIDHVLTLAQART